MRKSRRSARELSLIRGAGPRNRWPRRILNAALPAIIFLLLNGWPAHATVCSFHPAPDPTVDGSPTSLRHAIQMANASGQDCLITLQAGTYTLTIKNTNGHENAAVQGDLDITDSGHTVTIVGPGPGRTAINGNGIDRVFHVVGGANAVLHNLTIEGGIAQDDATPGALPGSTTSEGGGFMVEGGGHVTLTGVFVKGNVALGGGPGQAAAGGGLYLSSGTINFANSNISGNAANAGNGHSGFAGGSGGAAAGGGLYVASGILNLSSSMVSGNHASGGGGGSSNTLGGPGGPGQTGAGGGLYVLSGTVKMWASTLSENGADGGGGGFGHVAPGGAAGNGDGGGLFFGAGTLSLSASTVSGNSVTGGGGGLGKPIGHGGSSQGGGVFVAGGNVRLANSTFYGNTANNGGVKGGTSAGGALFVTGGSVNLTGLTVALNHAAGGAIPGSSLGGGIQNSGANSLVSDSTLIGDNTRDTASTGGGPDVSGALTASFSLISNTSGATITDDGNNIFGKSPVLEPPASNGGPTQTVALQSNSPAIDAGDNVICLAPAPTGLAGVDQRGFARSRPGDARCDIGAFEFINVLVVPSTTVVPTGLNFGSEPVHNQTPARTLNVTNNEAATVTLTESIGGADPADFVTTASTCGTTLGSTKTCSISIAFKPNTSGTRSAVLTVSDKPDRTSPYHVTLIGKGQ